ncbi:60S acidic ribosomal protein P2B [Camellia lanceoleosa]|uniref:60S acidic ribosomal protein P2B n=1 Tax=Camellia lanceoleosa TaxID=1840588 RepID=A0ACC0G756_9ERIC|nr:60S acidic ribosomal protein P2B [Camellia lanceoleosa]
MMLLSERGLVVISVIIKSVLWIGGGVCSDAVDWCKFEAIGAEADDDRIQLLLSEVKGKDITELIASGREKLASVPSGGGGAIAVTSYGGGGGGGGAAAPAAAEPKKEEKVEEKEESDDDMGFSLFD